MFLALAEVETANARLSANLSSSPVPSVRGSADKDCALQEVFSARGNVVHGCAHT